MLSKRDLLRASAAAFATCLPVMEATAAGQDQPVDSDMMSQVPANWVGTEKIAFLIYPEFTALDMVGPYHMLTSLMGATTHVVAKTREIVKSDAGSDVPAFRHVRGLPGRPGYYLRSRRLGGHACGDAGRGDDQFPQRSRKPGQVCHIGVHGIDDPRRRRLADGISSYVTLGREVSVADLWCHPIRGAGGPRPQPHYRRWRYRGN